MLERIGGFGGYGASRVLVLGPLLGVWPCTCDSTPLSLYFVIWKMGIIVVSASLSGIEDKLEDLSKGLGPVPGTL